MSIHQTPFPIARGFFFLALKDGVGGFGCFCWGGGVPPLPRRASDLASFFSSPKIPSTISNLRSLPSPPSFGLHVQPKLSMSSRSLFLLSEAKNPPRFKPQNLLSFSLSRKITPFFSFHNAKPSPFSPHIVDGCACHSGRPFFPPFVKVILHDGLLSSRRSKLRLLGLVPSF